MARDETQGDPGAGDAGGGGATEPITLTDPDGAVTRVAPWSSWTREQVRAPGGEPALVTRLEHGQLWFAAGRTRSPWRHEVHVGPAIVSTPRGRFQATAEADGGATVACLSGRTRVVAGLREPVVLGPDQSAAVSSDGATLVVMDRVSGDERPGTEYLADEGGAARSGSEAPTPPAAAPDDHDHDLDLAPADADLELGGSGATGDADGDGGAGDGPDGPTGPAVPVAPDRPDRHHLRWVPELVAVAALLGVLVAAVIVFAGTGSDDTEAARATVVTTETGRTSTTAGSTEGTAATTATPTTATPTTEAPTTAPPTTAAPTTAPPTTAPPTTAPPVTVPPAVASQPGAADGDLVGCRRAPDGVVASVTVSHRDGGPSRFRVDVGVVDRSGRLAAQAQGQTTVIEPGGTVTLDLLVPTDPALRGACELIGVLAI